MAVAAPSNVIAPLVQEWWDNELHKETLRPDIFSALTTVFDGLKETKQISLPEAAIVMQMLDFPVTGERQGTIGFVNALTQPGGEGDLYVQLGAEETIRTKSQPFTFNEFSHGVSSWGYGIHYHDAKPYGIYTGGEQMPMITKLLGNHAWERFGLYRRQALLQRLSQNLTQSPINQNQTWNPHWYIKGIFDNQQPVYNTNNQTFTNRIATAFIQAGTGINAALDGHYMIALKNRAKQLRIEPLTLGGKSRYIFTCPSEQTVWFRSLDVPGSGTNWWTSFARMSKTDQEALNFLNPIGEWDSIIVVEDERAPTITIGGSSEPFTLTPGYCRYGNDDERDTSAGARQIGFLLGNGPLLEPYPEKIHHEYDNWNYKRWLGKGYFGMIGDTLRMYDNPTPGNATFEQRWCIVCGFARNAMYS